MQIHAGLRERIAGVPALYRPMESTTADMSANRNSPVRPTMNRLHTEFRRLFLPAAAAGPDTGAGTLINAGGYVRAVVLELARPASWETLSEIWSGVQTDLGLPAPAIAVSGTDGLQLWFSMSDPIAISQAQAFLQAVRDRYLMEIASDRVRLLPTADTASASGSIRHAEPVPALQTSTGCWSAFVAPDFASLFAETPWLDIPPSDDG